MAKELKFGQEARDLLKAGVDQLAEAVKSGKLTQAQADDISANLKTRITDQVTHTRPAGGPGRHHGGGPFGAPDSPTPSTTPG